ncbi:MAG: hypothetical protein Kow0037_12630 [Calditrichia bacterium]
MDFQGRIPVVILGGSHNALSISRSLGKRGVPIYLYTRKNNHANWSRYVSKNYPYEIGQSPTELWKKLLLEEPPQTLEDAVTLPCNDQAVEFVCHNYEELKRRYRLVEIRPQIQLKMLNKLETLKLAKAAGIPYPKFLEIDGNLQALPDDFQFPVMVRPEHSHLFQKRFDGKKLFIVHNPAELQSALKLVREAGIKAIISEIIPGADSLLCSYYTYIDENDQPLFTLTKRIIRRFKKNHGLASYHITDWNPEVAELGQKFLAESGYRGLANVEFKRDVRDGKLKIIECNCRFTAAQELLVKSGLDLAGMVYRKLTGQPFEVNPSYRKNVTYWYPVRDFLEFLELRRFGELKVGQWIKSVARPHVLPFFSLADPAPSIIPVIHDVLNKFRPQKV